MPGSILPRTVDLFAQRKIELHGRAVRIADGPGWLGRQDLPLVSGAWYSEGF